MTWRDPYDSRHPDVPSPRATRRQKEVAEALGRGLSYKAACLELGMRSEHTVRNHAKALVARLEPRAGVAAQARIRMWANSIDGRAILRPIAKKREHELAQRKTSQVA